MLDGRDPITDPWTTAEVRRVSTFDFGCYCQVPGGGPRCPDRSEMVWTDFLLDEIEWVLIEVKELPPTTPRYFCG